MTKEKLIMVPIRITKEQREWLDKHPEINLSALVRRFLDNFFIPYYNALNKALAEKYKHRR